MQRLTALYCSLQLHPLKLFIMPINIIDRASLKQAIDNGEVYKEYYSPSDSMEYFDGENFYNLSGDMLRDVEEFSPYSEGYTPFGDE